MDRRSRTEWARGTISHDPVVSVIERVIDLFITSLKRYSDMQLRCSDCGSMLHDVIKVGIGRRRTGRRNAEWVALRHLLVAATEWRASWGFEM